MSRRGRSRNALVCERLTCRLVLYLSKLLSFLQAADESVAEGTLRAGDFSLCAAEDDGSSRILTHLRLWW